MTKEKDIVFEIGNYWVCKTKNAYCVMVSGITHSTSESCYELTEDGLSIAVARCKYLDKSHRVCA